MRTPTARAVSAFITIACASVLVGCGHAAGRQGAAIRILEAEARPIGLGARFHEPVRGRPVGRCTRRLGPRDAAHIEIFAENRVVLLPSGIGTQGPLRASEGRIVAASCYGALVTLDPTGVVLALRDAHLTIASVFRSWGQPLSRTRLAGFAAPHGRVVEAFVDGRRRPGNPGTIPIATHAEIVLEVGPHVPPHQRYTFPPTP